MNAESMPALGFLVEIESPADLDDPSVVGTDLSVVDGIAEVHFELDSTFDEAVAKTCQRLFHLKPLLLIIVPGYKLNLLDRPPPHRCLAESNEVFDLMGEPNVGLFDHDLIGSFEIRAKERIIAVSRVPVVDREVALLSFGLCFFPIFFWGARKLLMLRDRRLGGDGRFLDRLSVQSLADGLLRGDGLA